MNRRSFIRNTFVSMATLIGMSGLSYYYAREIEPEMLRINNETIAANHIPHSFNDFKIIQFSDTHVGFHYTEEQLTDLVSKINKLKPDLIVFTGDLIDAPHEYKKTKQISEILYNLQAEYGKYWIYGNHDHGGYGTQLVHDIMEDAHFHLLQNSHIPIQRGQDEIILAGIDDVILGTPDLPATLKNVNEELFTILLAHEPDFADTTVNFPVDVQLSGHSHGGQVRLPFIGHLYTPTYAEKYIQGKYRFNQDKLLLYVNKGIGTTRLPFRFFCQPEIHSYTLKSNP